MKKILLGFLANILILSNVLAGEIETKKVISTGVGITESDALKDATRNAVQQVVGVYILTDTYSKNSQIIKDNILVNSNGYIKTFKVISQTKDDSGLFRVEAEIEVEPGQVTKRLSELNIVLKDVATTEFKAISLDKFQANKDFKKMFDEIVLKPIKENKPIYDIKIGELKSVDKFVDFQNQNDILMPFSLSFSLKIKEDYLNSVKMFLDKSAKEKINLPDIESSFSNYKISFASKHSESSVYVRTFYNLNDNQITTFNSLISSMNKYKASLNINLYDKSKSIIKIIKLSGYFGEYDMNTYNQINSRIIMNNGNTYYTKAIFFGFLSNGNTLSLSEFTSDLQLQIYLSEEEVSKIISSSIEIKWEEK